MRLRPRTVTFGLVFSLGTVFMLAGPAQASGGGLDPGFGVGGSAIADFNGGADQVSVMAIQPDGKILVGGTSVSASDSLITKVEILRYNTDGTLDTSFRAGGKLTIAYPGESSAWIDSMIVQPDGKIITSTRAFDQTGRYFAAVTRFLPNGTRDFSFGRYGKLQGWQGELALQDTGRIVLLGSQLSDTAQQLVRFNTDGSVDHSFGTDGSATLPAPGGESNFALRAMALGPNGRILLGGSLDSAIVASEVSSNGVLRTGFGGQGLASVDPGGSQTLVYGVGPGPDGSVLVGGGSQQLYVEGDLARFTSGGAPDPGFGSGGLVRTPSPLNTMILGFASDANGDVVATLQSFSTRRDLVLARYLPDGALDPTFGNAGIANAHLGANGGSAWPVLIQPDGNIVAAGWLNNGSTDDFAVARFLPN